MELVLKVLLILLLTLALSAFVWWRRWPVSFGQAVTALRTRQRPEKKTWILIATAVAVTIALFTLPLTGEMMRENFGLMILAFTLIGLAPGVANRGSSWKKASSGVLVLGLAVAILAAWLTFRPIDYELKENYFAEAAEKFQDEVSRSPNPRYRGEVFFTEFVCGDHEDEALELWIEQTSTSYLSPDSIRAQAEVIRTARCKKEIVAANAEEELFLKDLEEVTSLEEARSLYRSVACERGADRARVLAFERWAEYYLDANKARGTRTELLNEVQAQAKLLREQVCSKEELPAVKWEEAPYQKVSYNHTLFVGNDGFTRNGLPKCSLPTGEEVPPIVTHILLFKPDLKKGDEIKVYDERTAPRPFVEYCKTLPRQISEIWLYHETTQAVYVYTTCEGVKGTA